MLQEPHGKYQHRLMIADLTKRWHSFLARPETIAELATEFSSTNVARIAVEDLLAVWPTKWSTVTARCRPDPKLGNWLFILPNNHSLVGVYPLFCAYLCRLKVTVRQPQTRFAFLKSFLEFISNLPQAQLCLGDSLIGIDALLVYGHDLTINKLHKSINKPIVAFGTHDTVAVVTVEQLRCYPDLIVRDAFSLGQRGCLSVKMLFVTDGLPVEQDINSLQLSFKKFWRDRLPLVQRLAIDQERSRYRDSYHAKVNDGYPLFAVMDDKNFSYEQMMPRCHLVLPIVVGHWSWLENILRREQTIKTLVTNSCRQRLSGLRVVDLGYANRPCWDGTHEGRFIFRGCCPSVPLTKNESPSTVQRL